MKATVFNFDEEIGSVEWDGERLIYGGAQPEFMKWCVEDARKLIGPTPDDQVIPKLIDKYFCGYGKIVKLS